MAFSGRFVSVVLQAAHEFQEGVDTPIARQMADRERLAALLITTEIAVEPEPGIGLLDMAVFVTLKRTVWEEYWAPEVYGGAGQVMVEAYRALEEDIWQLVAGVFNSEQQAELRKLIADWRAQNPGQVSISHTRLAEIGDERRVSELVAAGKPGGMLAPVKEANRNIEELRLLTERLVFMLTRLQLAVNYQFDFSYSKLAMEPEVQQVLDNANTVAEAVDRFADAFARAVDQLPHEREAAVEQALAGLRAERQQLLADLSSEDGGLRPVLGDVRDTLEVGRQLAEMLNEAMINTDRLVKRVQEDEKSRPFDILEYHAALVQATATLEELQITLAAIEEFLGSASLESGMPQIVDNANRLEEEVAVDFLNRAFLRGVGLIVIFFVGLYLYRLATRRL
jgi:hypothetical protein